MIARAALAKLTFRILGRGIPTSRFTVKRTWLKAKICEGLRWDLLTLFHHFEQPILFLEMQVPVRLLLILLNPNKNAPFLYCLKGFPQQSLLEVLSVSCTFWVIYILFICYTTISIWIVSLKTRSTSHSS